jgi:hypothetical protein
MNDASDEPGRTLHREFVGMLFALAIAEVAIRSGEIVNSGLGFWTKAPALSHLFLAGAVIAASWVGWGWSKYSLSNVRHVFTRDFVELAMDVWLVAVYFFIVQGAERVVEVNGIRTIEASMKVEALWILVMFATYVSWDVLTKWRQENALVQRGWASIMCAALAAWTFWSLHALQGTMSVVLGDLSLLMIVLLFRAMKIHDLSAHTKSSWVRIVVLAVTWFALTRAALA